MRILVFFDLPTLTNDDLREYRRFRKYLVKNGFFMMQESIYSKIALNQTAAKIVVGNLHKHKPTSGIVQVLAVTERQYANMEYLVGELHTEVLESDERLVIL